MPMYLCKNTLLIILLFVGILLAESGYNTIYLMEFENQQNEFTNTRLTEALPDLIKENYKFREDIKVEYAGDIRPYIEQKEWSNEDPIKGLIINGRFQTINNEFFVEFEAYDIHNWKRLVKRQILCPVQDIICLHDGFLIAIEQSISPFLTDALDIDATISSLKQKPKKRSYENDLDKRSDSRNLAQLSDLNESGSNDFSGENRKQGQYGNRYYREFNIKDISKDINFSKEQNTEILVTILDQFLINPYDVIIGELSLIPDLERPGYMRGEIPVNYSVRSALAQELFHSLPHEKLMDDMGLIMQFSNSNFVFDDLLLEKLALMKYQLMPVIYFNNKIGGIQFIILDSWNDKYKHLELRMVTMLMVNQFRPLFAITPGSDNIQLNLDVSSYEVIYHFSIPYEKIGDYTKVTIKFMHEIELEELLESKFGGG